MERHLFSPSLWFYTPHLESLGAISNFNFMKRFQSAGQNIGYNRYFWEKIFLKLSQKLPNTCIKYTIRFEVIHFKEISQYRLTKRKSWFCIFRTHMIKDFISRRNIIVNQEDECSSPFNFNNHFSLETPFDQIILLSSIQLKYIQLAQS